MLFLPLVCPFPTQKADHLQQVFWGSQAPPVLAGKFALASVPGKPPASGGGNQTTFRRLRWMSKVLRLVKPSRHWASLFGSGSCTTCENAPLFTLRFPVCRLTMFDRLVYSLHFWCPPVLTHCHFWGGLCGGWRPVLWPLVWVTLGGWDRKVSRCLKCQADVHTWLK